MFASTCQSANLFELSCQLLRNNYKAPHDYFGFSCCLCNTSSSKSSSIQSCSFYRSSCRSRHALCWDTFQHTSMGTTKERNGSMDSETSSSSCILVHNILSSTLSFCNRVWNKTTCSQHRGLPCGLFASCCCNHQRRSHCSLYNYTSFSFWRGLLAGQIPIVDCCFPSIWSTIGRACGSLTCTENRWQGKKAQF
jgi:hypothetical protein